MIQSPSRMCHQTSGSLIASSPAPAVRMSTAASSALRGFDNHATRRRWGGDTSGAVAGGTARISVAMRAQRRCRDRGKTGRGRLATDSYTPRDGHRDEVSQAPADVSEHRFAASPGPGPGPGLYGPHDLVASLPDRPL